MGYPSKAGPERLSPTKVGTSPLKGGKPKPTGFFSHGLASGCLSSSRSKELSQDKARTPSFLHKDRTKNHLLSSDEERYCPPMSLYYSPSSPCLNRTPHLVESFGHGGPDEIPQDCVGSQGIFLTPLAILPPSSVRMGIKTKIGGKSFLQRIQSRGRKVVWPDLASFWVSQLLGTKRKFWSF